MAKTRSKIKRSKQSRRKIRKQRGGLNDTFFVYTTGFSDGVLGFSDGHSQTGPGSIIDKWLNRGILNTLLENIPRSYTRIQITHYDPVNIENADRILCNKEKERDRISSSNYLNERFQINMVSDIHGDLKNYILVDQAHVFTPTANPKEYTYSENGDPDAQQSAPIKLNLLYLGYFGGSDENPYLFRRITPSGERVLTFTKFFHVNPDGTVVSFIDKLREKGYPYGLNLIYKIVEENKPLAMKKFKTRERYSSANKTSNNRVRILAQFDTDFKEIEQLITDVIGNYLNEIMWGDTAESRVNVLEQEITTLY